ncbi:MAG: hypothetical protein VKP62_06485 [Candidatus Sericytochromatia bacterium]|nr:hypothetical protein [Candidatus Sericytochromatia bacterium]
MGEEKMLLTPSMVDQACETLARQGWLLVADPALPSLATLVAGEPIRGSWWGHPAGKAIYALSDALQRRPDVMVVKLVAGKLTYIHARLWPALLGVAMAGEPWQVQKLSAEAKWLQLRMADKGRIRLDQMLHADWAARDLARAAKLLESRLLIYSEDIETERGAQTRALEPWQHWRERTGYDTPPLAPQEGRQALIEAVAPLIPGGKAARLMPWPAS